MPDTHTVVDLRCNSNDLLGSNLIRKAAFRCLVVLLHSYLSAIPVNRVPCGFIHASSSTNVKLVGLRLYGVITNLFGFIREMASFKLEVAEVFCGGKKAGTRNKLRRVLTTPSGGQGAWRPVKKHLYILAQALCNRHRGLQALGHDVEKTETRSQPS